MSTDKVAIITAGGSGMGAAAARKLAADGYRVAILSSSGKGEALAAELGGLGVGGGRGEETAGAASDGDADMQAAPGSNASPYGNEAPGGASSPPFGRGTNPSE